MHVLLFLTLLICATATALYDDQIGKFDWKKEFVGDVIAVDFESSISVSKYVFVATKLNTVACFNTRTGRIEWRKIISEKDGHVIGIKHTKEGLLGVTSGGIAHLWETSSGSLKWEANLATSAEKGEEYTAHAFAVLERTYSEGNLLVVLSSNGIHTVPLSKHNPSVETVAFEEGGDVFNPSLNKIFVDSNNGRIIHLVLTPSSRLSVNIYDAKELASGAQVTVETPWLDSLDMSLLLEDNELIYISAETQSFYLVDLTQGATKLTSSYAGLGVQEITGLVGVSDTDVANHGSEFIVIHSSNQISQITVEDKEALKVKWNQHVENLQNVEIKQLGAEVYVFVATVDNSLLSVTATNLKTGSVDENSILTHKLENKDAGIEKIYVNMFLKRSTPIGFRLLVKSDDSSVMLVAHPNRVMWRRHESLAEIVDAAMIDLPLSDADAGIEAEFDESSTTKRPMLAGMFAKRIKAQSQQLLSWFRQVMKEVEEGTLFKHKTRDPLIQVEGLTRDPFSLHKMIVVVTKSGTLFGIDSLSGDIVWRHYIPNLEKSARWNFYFYVQRTTAHFPHPPQMALLALDSDHSQQPVLLTFNPITGEVNKQNSLLRPDAHIIQVMLLPSTDASHLRPLILLNSDMTLQLFPDSSDVRSLINTLNLFMYDVDTTSGTLRGFSLNRDLTARPTWVVKVPPSHKISTVAGKKMLEKVDSLGRPLADRSVIFKYLNPNAIAVVSESLDANVDRSSLFLLIVDAVTGQTIHSSYHKKATGPVKIIHSENWLLYSYWNAKARRTEITSMELYEGKTQHNSTAFSSFEVRPSPIVMQQSYIFPTGISCIGVSQTDKAITSRQILFGLKRGALLGLPRRFFDPRRPLTMEDSHREEGLVQYMPEIPIPPELFLSYNLSIESIDGVYSAPAALESTSLVLTTGIDIFFTRTQPSKMFDVLKEDFDHFFISTVLIGMFVAALVVRRMSQIKQLKKAWK